MHLAFRTPLAARLLLEWLAARAVPGVEEIEGERYRRSLRLAHGAGVVEVTLADDAADARLWLDDERDEEAAVEKCRRLLDLDADPDAVAAVLGGDPLLGPLVAARAQALGVLALAGVDVGDDELRAPPGQQPRHAQPHVPEPDDRRRAALERRGPQRALDRGQHRRLDAERRVGAGIARAPARARQGRDVPRALRDHRHVARGRPDVLGRDVGAVHRGDGVGEVEEDVAPRGAVRRSVGQHDHALAAAQGQPGHRGLVGHRARQAQGVAHGGPAVVVAPQATAPERRPAHGRVHGDDAVHARTRPAPHEQLLVLEGGEVTFHRQRRR